MHKSQNYMQWIKRKSKMLPRQQYYQDRVQLTDRLQDVFADVEILVGTPLTTQNDSSYSSHYIIPYLILHCDKRCMSEWGVVDDESFPSNLRTPSDSASCMWLKTRRHYSPYHHNPPTTVRWNLHSHLLSVCLYGAGYDESILSPNDRLWFDKRFLF